MREVCLTANCCFFSFAFYLPTGVVMHSRKECTPEMVQISGVLKNVFVIFFYLREAEPRITHSQPEAGNEENETPP